VGFWGSLVVVRSQTGLAGLPALEIHVDDQDAEWRGGDWAVGQFGDADLDLSAVAALALQTGAPALAAQIYDSDNAVIRGVIPGHEGWETTLRPASMRSKLEFLGQDYDTLFPMSPDEATAAAVSWARAAGLSPEVHHVARLFRAEDCVFVEELYFSLLEHLGLPNLIVLDPVDDE